MAQCTTYQSHLLPNSPLSTLYQYLRTTGISDADLDLGYAQIDYHEPRRWGSIVGKGDCTIDPREVEEYVLSRWEKYRGPVRAWLGKALPWDYDVSGLAEKSPEAIERREFLLAHATMAIETIKLDLLAAHIPPDSDVYRTRLAEGLYWWSEFPLREEWNLYDTDQRREILDHFDRLHPLGLVRLYKFLLTAGGAGGFYDRALGTDSTQKPNQFSPLVVNHFSPSFLYSVFEAAGLHPSFLEMTGLSPHHFVCNENVVVHLGVGVMISGRWRAFDPLFHHPDASEDIFYPLSLRQALAFSHAQQYFSGFMVGEKPHVMETGAEVAGDSFASLLSWFLSSLALLSQSQGSGESNREKIKHMIETAQQQPALQHPVFSAYLAIYALGVGGSFSFSPYAFFPQQGLAEYVQLLSAALSKNPAKQEVKLRRARALLTLDPRCTLAHLEIAREGVERQAPVSTAELERHFVAAAEAIPQDDENASYFYVLWGMFHLAQAQPLPAREKFDIAVKNVAGSQKWRARAALHLARYHAMDGEMDEAARLASTARALVREQMRGLGMSDAEDWWTWLEDQLKSFPLPPAMLQDDRVMTSYSSLYSMVGNVFLYHRIFPQAEVSFRRALELSPENEKDNALLYLHELMLQRRRIKEARATWQEIERRTIILP